MQLRKNKREEGLAKRRNLTHINNFTAEGSTTNPEAPKPAASNPKYTVDDIPALTAGLHAADVKLVGESLKGFRRLLSIEPDPPVVEVMNAGVLPTFVALLQRCAGLARRAADRARDVTFPCLANLRAQGRLPGAAVRGSVGAHQRRVDRKNEDGGRSGRRAAPDQAAAQARARTSS